MTSINTNTSAMSALQTLRATNNALATTQDRVSSGYKVNSASDNAAYWSIATTMRSDNEALSAVSDALGLGAAKVDTAYSGMEAAIDVVSEIKNKLVTATEEGADKAKIQEEIDALQDQLKSIAESASFNGENWIIGSSETKSVVSSFVRSSDGSVSVKTSTYQLSNDGTTGNVLFGATDGVIDESTGILGTTNATTGYSVYSMDISSATSGDIGDMLSQVQSALDSMTSAASALGSVSTRITLQEDFVSKLSDSLESGIGRLVDADMEEESSRLTALQTQQQLSIQALSIANSSTQSILQLFQ